MNWDSTAKIRKREICLPVAPVRCAKECEQCLVLIDRQELPVAKRPPFGREIKRYDFYFTKEGF